MLQTAVLLRVLLLYPLFLVLFLVHQEAVLLVLEKKKNYCSTYMKNIPVLPAALGASSQNKLFSHHYKAQNFTVMFNFF